MQVIKTFLQELYSENTKYLQVALRHFSTNRKMRKTAAQAAQIAGEQGKFWEYSQKLHENFSNISVWETENYLSLAEEFSLSTEEFARSLEEKVFEPIIKADIEDAEAFEVKTTPTFFLNETRLEVTGPEDLRQKVLDEIDKIKGNIYNPNVMDEKIFELAKENIKREGFVGAIICRENLERKGEYIIIDGKGRTNIDGVYAVGDVTSHSVKRIITAVGHAASAVNDIFEKRGDIQE